MRRVTTACSSKFGWKISPSTEYLAIKTDGLKTFKYLIGKFACIHGPIVSKSEDTNFS